MNKTLQEEELDRELALKHGPSFMDVVKIKVGKKTLTLFANDGALHEDYQGKNSRLTLQKSNHNGESLRFTFEWNEYEYARCNLGHNHQSKKLEKKFLWHDLDWQYVEQLIDWLQLGTWREIQGKEPVEHGLLRESRALLAEISTVSTAFGPACKKVIRKINERLGDS